MQVSITSSDADQQASQINQLFMLICLLFMWILIDKVSTFRTVLPDVALAFLGLSFVNELRWLVEQPYINMLLI